MNETMNLPLLLMIITTVLLYVIGIIAMLQSIRKYKYSSLWLIVAIILIICPVLIFILYSYREKVVLKKSQQIKEKIKSEMKFKGMMVLFLIYYALGVFLSFFLRYGVYVEWSGECALFFVNTMFLFFIFAYIVYGKKQIDKLLNMQELK